MLAAEKESPSQLDANNVPLANGENVEMESKKEAEREKE
jgi:hypothetical protein